MKIKGLFVGPVCSGKSTRLIQLAKDTPDSLYVCFDPDLGFDLEERDFESRSGEKIHGVAVGCLSVIPKTKCTVFVDECQFALGPLSISPTDSRAFTRRMEGLFTGDVYLAGLDLTWSRMWWPATAIFLAYAEEISKCKARCVVCGKPAGLSRKSSSNASFDIVQPGRDLFEPVCQECYDA